MKAFIRFGEIPQNERSSIHAGDSGKVGEEIGVSVYDAVKIDGEWRIVMPSKMSYSTCVTLSGFLEKEFKLVTGDIVGHGSDGEPLIVNVKPYEEAMMTREEAQEELINNTFSAVFNGNDFFAYACAWAVEISEYDFHWMIKHTMKHGKDGLSACVAYIQNKEPIKPYLTDKFMEAMIELVERKQEVHGDGDYDQYYTVGGPYREINKED